MCYINSFLDVMLLSTIYMYIYMWCYSVGLPAPDNVQATAKSHSSIEVTWDQLYDVTEYTISYSTTASHISGGSVTVKGTSCTLSGLVENTRYAITVQAVTGNSRNNAVSSEVSVITHAAGKSHI